MDVGRLRARLDGMNCLGLTIATCPDHPAADSMSGKLFRHGFLTDLGWTVNEAPTMTNATSWTGRTGGAASTW